MHALGERLSRLAATQREAMVGAIDCSEVESPCRPRKQKGTAGWPSLCWRGFLAHVFAWVKREYPRRLFRETFSRSSISDAATWLESAALYCLYNNRRVDFFTGA